MSDHNSVFEAIRNRRATREFSTKEIPEKLLIELLELANRSPSAFNLQPWHFVVVKNPELKKLLRLVAMNQKHVEEAPVVVVFVADPDCWENTFPEIVTASLLEGHINKARANRYTDSVNKFFKTSPLGIFGLLKKLTVPVLRLFKPLPNVITSYQEAVAYVRAQTMIAASTFMIAAKAAGLDTCPMEGFDEERLKKLLAIPGRMTVPVIIPLGYALEKDTLENTYRLPIEKKLSIDYFMNKVVRIKK